MIEQIKRELASLSNPKEAPLKARFFRAYPGGYGEGDQFIGVTVPNQRKVAKKYFKEISLREIEVLLIEPIHEYRLTGVFMLVLKYQKTKDEQLQEEIVNTYLKCVEGINNWDLVDSSAHHILGPQLMRDEDTGLLYELAQSGSLWEQRIAVIATFHFINHGEFEDSLNIAEMLINHKHDLIHKAVGWMLREVGKRDYNVEYSFLVKHYKKMPRTMLRYAIEKFPEDVRQGFLKGEIG